jgi:hypothetical protein
LNGPDSLAERIDKRDGNTTASSIAKVLLTSSLSSAETPLRGLTEGELIEAMIDPLLEVSEIKSALGSLQGQAWYLFQGIDQRIFFGPTANVTAQITEIASNIADEQVDQALRNKLKEVFKPRTGNLYSDKMAILPAPDEIELDDERPTLIILEWPAGQLPKDFDDWWKHQDRQNRVLVLTADANAISTLRTCARRMRAIDKVRERIKAQHGDASLQMEELRTVESREANGFTSALRETFKTIVFPTGKQLRKVDDFRMEFDRNDYSGEQQIIETLAKRGKYIPPEKFEEQFEILRLDAEEILFDADAVQVGSLKRNAAARSGWFWLPRGGIDALIKAATQRGFWLRDEGLIAKKWEKITRVSARHDDSGPNPIETGRFIVNVTPEHADTVYVSEEGPPDAANAKKLDGRIYETGAAAAWFLAVDSSGKNKTGAPCEWRAPIRVKPDIKSMSSGHRITFLVSPRSAVLRATFDGSDPRTSPPLESREIDAPKNASKLRVIAEICGQFSLEESATLDSRENRGGILPPQKPLKPDVPARLTSRIESNDTAQTFSALDRLAKTPGAVILGGKVELNGSRLETDFIDLRLGRGVALSGADLDGVVKNLLERLKADTPIVKLRLDRISFPSGRDLTSFCDLLGQDFARVTYEQDA